MLPLFGAFEIMWSGIRIQAGIKFMHCYTGTFLTLFLLLNVPNRLSVCEICFPLPIFVYSRIMSLCLFQIHLLQGWRRNLDERKLQSLVSHSGPFYNQLLHLIYALPFVPPHKVSPPECMQKALSTLKSMLFTCCVVPGAPFL